MGRLSTQLCGIPLKNPIIPASGTFGFGYEFAELYDINVLGSIALKGTTREARYGNETPRIAECSAGMINSVGLQNPGVDAVVNSELARLAQVYNRPVIANVSGFSIEEYCEVAARMDAALQVGWIELNISCPNVHGGGMAFGLNPQQASLVTRSVAEVITKPLIVKLSPNVTDIVEIAAACVAAGAQGLCLINTLQGMRIDIARRRPVIAAKMGGFSGPAIFPVALRMVYQVTHALDVPVIGVGGIQCAEDVIEMMMAGAVAVEIGSANLVDPYVCPRIIDELPRVLDRLGVDAITDIIGVC